MNRLCLCTAALLLLAVPAFAGVNFCMSESLDNYEADGDCFIEHKQTSGWTYGFALGAGADLIRSSNVMVTPLETPFNPGFRFEAPWSVTGEQFQTSTIRFVITRNPFAFPDDNIGRIKDNTLVIGGAKATGDGFVKVEEFKCLGADFADVGLGCGEEETPPLVLTADENNPSRRADFAPVKFVDVLLKITVDAGTVGSAGLESVTIRFSEVPPVPEPAALLLAAFGAASLLHVRRQIHSPARRDAGHYWLTIPSSSTSNTNRLLGPMAGVGGSSP